MDKRLFTTVEKQCQPSIASNYPNNLISLISFIFQDILEPLLPSVHDLLGARVATLSLTLLKKLRFIDRCRNYPQAHCYRFTAHIYRFAILIFQIDVYLIYRRNVQMIIHQISRYSYDFISRWNRGEEINGSSHSVFRC